MDAIGVIHEQAISGIISVNSNQFINGPNPIKESQKLRIDNSQNLILTVKIFDAVGQLFKEINISYPIIESNDLPLGLFFIHLSGPAVTSIYKGLKL